MRRFGKLCSCLLLFAILTVSLGGCFLAANEEIDLPAGETSATPFPAATEAPAEEESEQETKPSTDASLRERAEQLIPHFALRWYLQQMDSTMLENFCALYKAASNFETSCELPIPIKDETDVEVLMYLMRYECPELFMVNFDEGFMYTTLEGTVRIINLSYGMGEDVYDFCYSNCLKTVQRIAGNNEGLTDFEKEVAAYNAVASSCTYDMDGENASNACGVLISGAAKCDGISCAMKWICEEMGLSCLVVAGKNESDPVGHAWNCVRIDGVYRDVDVTNDCTSESEPFYGAFNVPRSQLSDLYPISEPFGTKLPLPESCDNSGNWHVMNNTYVWDSDETDLYLNRLFEQAKAIGSGSILLQFESTEGYEKFLSGLDDSMRTWSNENCATVSYMEETLPAFRVVRIEIEVELAG